MTHFLLHTNIGLPLYLSTEMKSRWCTIMLQYIHQNTTIPRTRIKLQLKGVHNATHYSLTLSFTYSEAWVICNYLPAFSANQNYVVIVNWASTFLSHLTGEQKHGLSPDPEERSCWGNSAEVDRLTSLSSLSPCWKIADLLNLVGHVNFNGV